MKPQHADTVNHEEVVGIKSQVAAKATSARMKQPKLAGVAQTPSVDPSQLGRAAR